MNVVTRTFIVSCQVSREFLASADDPEATILKELRSRAQEDFVGPRGGRYVPVGSAFHFRVEETAQDRMAYRRTYTARVQAKYVRPSSEPRDA